MNYAFLPCMELIVATLHACLSSVITANFMQNSQEFVVCFPDVDYHFVC